MTKKAISATITSAIARWAQGTVVFADQLMSRGFHYATPRRNLLRVDGHRHSGAEDPHRDLRRQRGEGIQDQYASGLVTNGEALQQGVDIWSRANDQVAKP